MNKPRVALVHDYLVQYGGAEKTLESIIELYPDAPIYTSIYKPDRLSEKIKTCRIITPDNALINKFPKYLTFLMPLIFESFDLREYDIIISDSSAWAKGVITKPEQLHISYIHTPPRFLYKYTSETTSRNKWYFKPFVALIDSYLRTWDYEAAQRPDYLLTNSLETQKRIQKFYKRNSRVIYPPVDLVNKPYVKDKDNLHAPFYLSVGRLAAYKNIDLIIQGFNLTGIPLVIIGAGKEEERLKKMAKENVTFLGPVSDEETHKKFEECLGFIFPVVDEEFGIAAVEAISHGKPVLAHRSGGPLEIIQDGIDGMFFDKADIETFVKSLKEFDSKVRNGTYSSSVMKEHAQPFNKARFKNELSAFVNKKWEEKNHNNN